MDSVKNILNNIPESSKNGESLEDVMKNPGYLRHSSNIISEALQKGFDVLQLENGDIVTTGTKIIVTQFHWDEEKQAMVKLSAKERKLNELNEFNESQQQQATTE